MWLWLLMIGAGLGALLAAGLLALLRAAGNADELAAWQYAALPPEPEPSQRSGD